MLYLPFPGPYASHSPGSSPILLPGSYPKAYCTGRNYNGHSIHKAQGLQLTMASVAAAASTRQSTRQQRHSTAAAGEAPALITTADLQPGLDLPRLDLAALRRLHEDSRRSAYGLGGAARPDAPRENDRRNDRRSDRKNDRRKLRPGGPARAGSLAVYGSDLLIDPPTHLGQPRLGLLAARLNLERRDEGALCIGEPIETLRGGHLHVCTCARVHLCRRAFVQACRCAGVRVVRMTSARLVAKEAGK